MNIEVRIPMRFATSVLALLFAAPLAAFAQDFPSKSVRIVVPYPPGGGVDNMARPIAERLITTMK